MDKKEQTRQKILDAARTRFEHYGFNKTTMAEIAGDCKMSTANIYRFFKNKSAIVAQMAQSYFDDTELALAKVARQKELTPLVRLEAFTLEILQCTFELISQPKMNEIVDFIEDHRTDLISQHESKVHTMVVEILTDGNRCGSFDIADVEITAGAILHATVLFHCPFLMKTKPLEELQHLAREIITLLIKGLEIR